MKVHLLAAVLVLPAGIACAGSHSEAPMVSIDTSRAADLTDTYSFRSDRKALAVGSLSAVAVGPTAPTKGLSGTGFPSASSPTTSSVNN